MFDDQIEMAIHNVTNPMLNKEIDNNTGQNLKIN